MAETATSQEEPLRQARRLIEGGDFESAQVKIDQTLTETPRSRDALYMKAVCARYRGALDEALDAVATLKSVAPDYGRGHQEEGHILAALGRGQEALIAYRRACHFNPSLLASWERQAEILATLGDAPQSKAAQEQAGWLKRQPREVVAVMNHIHEGRILKAERLCRALLQRNPKHVEAMRMLADIGARLNILDDAEFILESAAAFEPENIAVKLDYIQILRKRQKYDAALKQAETLYEHSPDDPTFMSNLAIESMHNNQFERAFDLFERVLEKIPGDPATLTSRGHALKTFGRQDDAIASYREACAAMPEYGDAWFGLANLKTYRFTDEEVDEMKREEAADRLSYSARIQLCFALAKALEDRKEFRDAFTYYERGNELKRVQSRYDADQMTAELRAQEEIATTSLFDAGRGTGHPAPDPIFIVGLPRAGSTLLEQILASHSQIDGTLELPNILALAHRLRNRKNTSEPSHYPANLYDLTTEQRRSFGEAYIRDTRVHRAGAPFFIDKMPNNFRHIALIQLILPNAKIIDARRAPMACCFSGFKQLFAEGQDFTYGLEQIGRYYHDYVHLMRCWDQAMPGRILRVQYEDVVADVEGQVRRILDYLELPFEEACIEFHKNDRVVRTASSEQVRQPINDKGLEAWRPFDPWLDPLKQALGDVKDDYRR